METETTEAQAQPSIGIYPSNVGIVLEISDGSGDTKQLVLDPDDASKIAIQLISNVTLFQLNNSMRMAAEKAEEMRLREAILNTKDFNINDPFTKKR